MTQYQWAAPEAEPFTTPILIDGSVCLPGIWRYTQAMELVDAGEATIAPYAEPAPPAPVVPQVVSQWQAREALRLTGRLAAVNAYMDLSDPDDEVYVVWNWADNIRRYSPFIEELAPVFGLSEQDLDDLFVLAGSLGS